MTGSTCNVMNNRFLAEIYNMNDRISVGVVLFDGFELLDVFGPLEMFGQLPDHFELCLIAESGDIVTSNQGPRSIVDFGFDSSPQFNMLLVPGGNGTRREVHNPVLLEWLRSQAENARYVTSVCTGSALLARAGLLDGRRATTNKAAFDWVISQSDQVDWQKQARWIKDGRFFTSSGVSAGMDMSLALIAEITDLDTATQVAIWSEYEWHQNPDWDPFAAIYGLV
jgi:transcriptional regulator GlxA family with amidase domain